MKWLLILGIFMSFQVLADSDTDTQVTNHLKYLACLQKHNQTLMKQVAVLVYKCNWEKTGCKSHKEYLDGVFQKSSGCSLNPEQ